MQSSTKVKDTKWRIMQLKSRNLFFRLFYLKKKNKDFPSQTLSFSQTFIRRSTKKNGPPYSYPLIISVTLLKSYLTTLRYVCIKWFCILIRLNLFINRKYIGEACTLSVFVENNYFFPRCYYYYSRHLCIIVPTSCVCVYFETIQVVDPIKID